MHTLIVIAIGFILLALCTFSGRAIGGASGIATGAILFLPLWLIGAGINLIMGVKAGYSFKDETPIFLLIFVIPSAAALILWWRFR